MAANHGSRTAESHNWLCTDADALDPTKVPSQSLRNALLITVVGNREKAAI